MITMSNFGNNGRLGNQLFQYASLLGICNNTKNIYERQLLVLPKWNYSEYFKGNNIEYSYFIDSHNKNHYDTIIDTLNNINEENFNYTDYDPNEFHKANYNGYFQSKKYWEHCEKLIKDTLTFEHDYIYQVKEKFAKDNGQNIFEQPDDQKPIIGIHIRRTDYIDNLNYYQLPISYYILALEEYFPNWEDTHNIIIFSDDIEYCKIHFGCMFNVYYAQGNDIEDLCLMSECNNLILSNSSYSWWGAYLGIKKDKVIRPNHLFSGELLEKNDDKDFWNEEWINFEHENKKINLKDVTFTIPYKHDHKDREENFHLCTDILVKDFDTKVIVYESYTDTLNYLENSDYFIYINDFNKDFHRTKMLNIMCNESFTPYIANWDCDIIIPPLQLLKTVKSLRNGIDVSYPYNGKFARIDRNLWYNQLSESLDIGNIRDFPCKGNGRKDSYSKGGAVLFNKKSFIKGGMENENFISFGAEDEERYIRFQKLGFKISRTNGSLYHMNHFIGIDSNTKNPYFQDNENEFNRINSMNKEELLEEIKIWKWNK